MDLAKLVIAPLAREERPAAALLAARAMRDNPMHIAALGANDRRRVGVMRSAFDAMFAGDTREVLGAWLGDRLVGVAAHTSSDHCQPDGVQWLRFVPTAARAGTRTPRLVRWLAAWGRRDLDAPHSHLGPVAVGAALRGHGIGSALMARYIGQLDARGETGYLETDRLANVRLYGRFGFQVVAEAQVLGVHNWFMARPRRT